MYYSSLAELYENLESTSLKLKKTRILAEFLENTPQNEIEHIILLCRGRVFPEWSEKELGIASLLMVKTLSKSYGVPEKKISDAWRDTGDLGLVAEEFSSKKRQKVLFAPKLNVDKVVSNLQKAAELSGAKSQKRKIDLIGELLSSAKPKEAKYLEECGVNIAYNCPMMYLQTPKQDEELIVTSSNKCRVYSTARFFFGDNLIKIITTGKLPPQYLEEDSMYD